MNPGRFGSLLNLYVTVYELLNPCLELVHGNTFNTGITVLAISSFIIVLHRIKNLMIHVRCTVNNFFVKITIRCMIIQFNCLNRTAITENSVFNIVDIVSSAECQIWQPATSFCALIP